MKNAYFAGGCFWCIAAAFTGLSGVKEVTDGYAGGDRKNPTYHEVKNQMTNHRETICIRYDEAVVSYAALLDFFFENIDPFDAGGQFIDRGFSYTPALFWQNETEKTLCEKKIAAVEAQTGRSVRVSVLPYRNFYPAEPEHQNYAQKNRDAFAEEYRTSGREAFFGKKES